MPAQYLPTVAWETIVRDVVVVDATHYYVSVYPENPNDPGSDLLSASVGQYLKDWIGHTYKIVEVNVGGVPLRLMVEDSFLTGVGPQQGLTGIVYQSPSGSPFLAPIRHFRLDDSALDYSRAIELDVLWSNIELKATQNTGICAETPIGIQDISIDYSTRIVTIIPPLGYFHYFTDGNGVVTKHEVVGSVSFPPFTNTTGVWHFYFNNNGDAISTLTPWTDFSLIATVLRIVWDNTKSPDSAKALTIFAEYHLNDISAIDHRWKHTYGAVWSPPGLDIFSNFLPSPSLPNADGRNTVIGLSSGRMLDDNLPHNITNTASPTTFWQQDLGSNTPALLNSTNSGIFKVRYKGGAGVGVVEDGTRFPFLWDVATNKPQYVDNAGVKTLVSNNSFFVYFVYMIPDGRTGHSIRITPAYAEYTTLDDSGAVTWETVQTQDEAARDTEIRPLYKLEFETKSSFSAGCKYSVLRRVTDIRKFVVTQTTASSGAILAYNVVYTPFTGIISTNVQSLGLELYNKFQGTLNYLPKYNATGITDSKFTDDGTTPKYNANTIWHSGNDGAGSGLDADLIDGYQASDLFTKGVYSEDANTFHNLGTEYWTPVTLNKPDYSWGTILNIQAGIDWKHQLEFGTNGDLTYRENIGSEGWSPRRKIWNSYNDGAGSGLDADLLDGLHGNSYARNEYNNNLISAGNEFNFVNGATNTDVYVNYRGVASTGITKYLFQQGKQNNTYADIWAKEFYANGGSNKVWHDGNSNLSTVDWTTKDLTAASAKIGTLNGFLKATAGVVGALSSIPESDISFTDITTGNVSTLKHGYIPKLSGSATDVFKGDGTWGSGGGASSNARLAGFYTDAATVGIVVTDLYSYTVTAGTFSADGMCIDSEFSLSGPSGVTNAYVYFRIDNVAWGLGPINFNGGSAIMRARIVRASNSTAKVSIYVVAWNNVVHVSTDSIYSKNFSTTDFIIKLQGQTPSGTLTATSGSIYKF